MPEFKCNCKLFSGNIIQNNKSTPILFNRNWNIVHKLQENVCNTQHSQWQSTNLHCLIYNMCNFGKIWSNKSWVIMYFRFQTTVSYGVIIPGNYSEIQSWVGIDVTMPEIKFHAHSISITVVLDVICKIESVFRPTNVHSRFLFRVHVYK